MALEIQSYGKVLEISDHNCSETQSIVKSLEAWTNKKCKLIEDCKYDIRECIPEHIAGVVGKDSGFDGPNCWNLALVMKGILPGLRFSTKDEMAFYMNSPLCRNLEPNEERKPGDVVAIRELVNKKTFEFHGFIYISDKLAFSKNGETYESSYELQPLNKVFASYQLSGNEQCYGNQVDLNSSCLNATSYYRCESLDDYLKKRKPLSMDLSKLVQQTSVYEKCVLEPFLINKQPLPNNAGKSIVDISKALAHYTEDLIKKNSKLTDEEKFIITSLDLRMRSISEQLKKSFNNESADALDLTRLNFK